jgi:hypothetical protein
MVSETVRPDGGEERDVPTRINPLILDLPDFFLTSYLEGIDYNGEGGRNMPHSLP